MKIRNLLITAAILFIGVFSFIILGRSGTDPETIIKPKEVVKVWTAMDSLIFNFEQQVSDEIDNSNTVGAAFAFVYQGEVRILKCFGETLNGSGELVDRNTIFRLASVSKPITGTLAGLLDKQDIIPLKSRIIDYLPSFRLKDSTNTHDLTVEHILSHTSGMVPHAYDNLVEAGVDFHEIMDSLFRVNISAVPGQLYGYQNVAFSLYDTILEVKVRESFENVMKEKVFQPFGMRDASVGMEAFFKNKNKALPHTASGRKYRIRENNEGYFITQPAAGINASISDISRFMLAMLGHNPGAIDTTTIHRILEPRVISPLRWNYLRNWKNVKSKHYALGWRIIETYGKVVAYHGGYIRGYRAELAICQEEDFGIAYLSNSPNGSGSGIIPMFLDMYFDEN